jgi:hypothetical protein
MILRNYDHSYVWCPRFYLYVAAVARNMEGTLCLKTLNFEI